MKLLLTMCMLTKTDKRSTAMEANMTTEKALDILERHNLWRRGADYVKATDPRLLGMAIDKAIEVLRLSNVVSQSEKALRIGSVSESKLRGDNFRIDLSEFEKLSREVGFYNAKSNIKEVDEHGNEFYDEEVIEIYEELRGEQLSMFNQMISFYSR